MAGHGGAFAVREFRFWLTNYRRTWQGSIYSSVLNPVLYLSAIGLGLGTLVDAHRRAGPGPASLGGVSYLVFLAPGLLAAAAMQTAMGESTYPVLGSVKWLKTYQAAAATPLWHGVALCRSLSLGTATLGGALVHVTYLVLLAAAGIAAGHRTYLRRLYV